MAAEDRVATFYRSSNWPRFVRFISWPFAYPLRLSVMHPPAGEPAARAPRRRPARRHLSPPAGTGCPPTPGPPGPSAATSSPLISPPIGALPVLGSCLHHQLQLGPDPYSGPSPTPPTLPPRFREASISFHIHAGPAPGVGSPPPFPKSRERGHQREDWRLWTVHCIGTAPGGMRPWSAARGCCP